MNIVQIIRHGLMITLTVRIDIDSYKTGSQSLSLLFALSRAVTNPRDARSIVKEEKGA